MTPAPGEPSGPVATASPPLPEAPPIEAPRSRVDPPLPSVSIIVPVTTPDAEVEALLHAYSDVLRRSGHAFEFVFVLDGVGGRVERELRSRVKDFPLKILRLQGGGLGESIALSAGVERASGELILNAPQYLQVEPEDIPKVIQALESGADFVATWRHPRVDPWLNRLQSVLFNWMLRVLMGIRFHDLNSSLRGMRRVVLEQVNVYGELYRFLPVLAMRQGFRTVEVKVRHREEKGREGFYGVGVYVRRLLDILAITFLTRFTQRPLRFFGTLGLLSMVIGFALSASPLYGKLVEDESGARPMLVIGAILIAFGIQLIGYGLVGEIIIFTQASNLRDYKVEEELGGEAAALPVTALAEPRELDSHPLRVRELLPGEDARWDAFVRAHRHGSTFHLTGWRKVVEDVFHHQPHYLVAERGRQWVGALPLFLTRSPFLGRNLLSVPYGVYGGMLAEPQDVQRALLAAATAHGRELGCGYIELRHVAPSGLDLVTSGLYVTFRKPLPASPDDVLPSIPKKARAEVRRARDKFGLKCEVSTDLDEFYGLFLVNKRKLGSPALPRRWFRALVEELGPQVVLHVARAPDRRPVAGVVSFCFQDQLCAYYSGADARDNHTGVNDFIYSKIMEWGAAQGFKVFDFGRSRRDTGPAHFKRNMGFEPEPLHYEYVMLGPRVKLPEFHPSNPKLRLPQRVWARLPKAVCEGLGGRLSRWIP